MKRKEFISSSILVMAGLSAFPIKSHLISFEKKEIKRLRFNEHNRHGYYGNEFIMNEFDIDGLRSIRIDHFENPEGDMTLFQITLEKENILVSAFPDETVISHNETTSSIQSGKNHNNLLINNLSIHYDEINLIQENVSHSIKLRPEAKNFSIKIS